MKLVYKNFPLTAIHKFAGKAALAALAADKQEKFWEFHQKLFENHKTLNDTKIEEIAQKTGLDMDRFNKDRKDPALEGLVIRDVQDGHRAGVRGTPTFFVNGRLLKNQSIKGLEEMIKAELKRRK